MEIEYPIGLGAAQLITFSDSGTAYGSTVLTLVQQ
jgi:hypothetical protein